MRLIDSDQRADFADAVNVLHPGLSVSLQNTVIALIDRVAEAQARETCKEIGEKMMRRSDFEAMRLVLLRGEMPCSKEG